MNGSQVHRRRSPREQRRQMRASKGVGLARAPESERVARLPSAHRSTDAAHASPRACTVDPDGQLRSTSSAFSTEPSSLRANARFDLLRSRTT